MKLKEDVIHIAIRKYLKSNHWQLIAGQFPNGSDDELHTLSIMNPELARDNSPDHRRHSKDKLVLDLIAFKNDTVLLIEMKPIYDEKDEFKLNNILSTRFNNFKDCFLQYLKKYNINLNINFNELIFIPCLGFSASSEFKKILHFGYFKVYNLENVEFIYNKVIFDNNFK